jgi:hypothetical protein
VVCATPTRPPREEIMKPWWKTIDGFWPPDQIPGDIAVRWRCRKCPGDFTMTGRDDSALEWLAGLHRKECPGRTWNQSAMLCKICMGQDCLSGDCSHWGPSILTPLLKLAYLRRNLV